VNESGGEPSPGVVGWSSCLGGGEASPGVVC